MATANQQGSTTGDDDPNKPIIAPPDSPWYTKDAVDFANGANTATRWVGNTLFPSTDTPSPNSSQPGQDNRDFYQGLNNDRENFQRPGVGTLVEGGMNPLRPGDVSVDPAAYDAQRRALALQQGAAEGTAPSAAEQLYRKGTDEAAASQLGMAATLQGTNPGQALRAGLAGGQAAYARNAADTAALRANEMASARHDFGATATAARGQTQDLAKANQEAKQRQYALENQFYLGLTDAQQKAQQAALDAEKQKTQNDVNARAGNSATLGKLFGSAGTLLAS